MFGNLKNMQQMMQMAGQAKEKLGELQQRLERERVTGEAGAGAVRVTLNGKGRTQRVELDPSLMSGLAGEDKDFAEELIAAAFNDAMEKVQQLIMDQARELTGGMNLPGMENLLGNDAEQ